MGGVADGEVAGFELREERRHEIRRHGQGAEERVRQRRLQLGARRPRRQAEPGGKPDRLGRIVAEDMEGVLARRRGAGRRGDPRRHGRIFGGGGPSGVQLAPEGLVLAEDDGPVEDLAGAAAARLAHPSPRVGVLDEGADRVRERRRVHGGRGGGGPALDVNDRASSTGFDRSSMWRPKAPTESACYGGPS